MERQFNKLMYMYACVRIYIYIFDVTTSVEVLILDRKNQIFFHLVFFFFFFFFFFAVIWSEREPQRSECEKKALNFHGFFFFGLAERKRRRGEMTEIFFFAFRLLFWNIK